MTTRIERLAAKVLVTAMLLAGGCSKVSDATADSHAEGDGHNHEAEPAARASNRVSISSAVRSNLGISFVKVERRRIEKTLRVPGQFEYLPTARREYRTMLPGRVELIVQQFDVVEEGAPLYRIDSPGWRDMQQQLAEAESAIHRLTTKLETFDPLMEAHSRHEQSLVDSVTVWTERVTQLESIREAGGGRVGEFAEARATLTSARADLADVQEKKAELVAARAETSAGLDAARSRLHYLLDAASSVVGVDRASLTTTSGSEADPHPAWATIDMIEVRAAEPGIVESLGLTNGSWADEKSAVMTIVRPEQLRFHASGLQSDLGVLRDGLDARIVPPTPTTSGRAVPLQDTMTGTLALGLQGDANDRTVDLYVVPEILSTWARPGISAQLEIVTDSTAGQDLAIPLAAVQKDGLNPVIFRRAPDNPNEAIRMEADLGANDGRWVAVISGLRDGDEVVLDGAFQLMLATSGSIEQGGHFHADGTFHEGED
ncbi:MAG: hypothetical protein KJO43_02795 [Phycisphaerae bacterium]|nr:hypothetical protein [Phycisphaerae bacterium]